MTANAKVRHAKSHGWLAAASAIASGLALIVIGYAMVDLPDHALLVLNEASASLEANQVSRPAPQAGPTPGASTARESRAGSIGERAGRTDSPRECAADRGITDDCVY